jgi:hypothetical protein
MAKRAPGWLALAAASILAPLLLASTAQAEPLAPVSAPGAASSRPDAPTGAAMETRERRDGVVLGLMGGFGLAGSSGYPNKASNIDDPNYYSSSDLLVGNGGTFFLMGALADYLNVGFWAGGGTFQSDHWRSSGGGAGIRIELFPLYALVPKLRDLGIVGQFGLGSSKLTAKEGAYPPAEGSQSFLGTGVFYEFPLFKMLGGHVAAGPSIEYNAIAGRSIERHWAMLGGRFVFYGGI